VAHRVSPESLPCRRLARGAPHPFIRAASYAVSFLLEKAGCPGFEEDPELSYVVPQGPVDIEAEAGRVALSLQASGYTALVCSACPMPLRPFPACIRAARVGAVECA